ncbi:hypothetical protein JG688_00000764 [Phytophthora aleatoria]|uniref:Uncharacterized protein n=1 Tax=Phytophthora aleatoria TaxID=2496075 RepID=A0A8J5JC05_9STRA|nr:hypothetical protein JG688_00000764 [Phytophthora aleatoria]
MQRTSGSPVEVADLSFLLEGVTSVALPAAATTTDNTHLAPKNNCHPQENSRLPVDENNERLRLLQELAEWKIPHHVAKERPTAWIRELQEENARLRDSATAPKEFAMRIQELEAENARLTRDNSIRAAGANLQIGKLQAANTHLQRANEASMDKAAAAHRSVQGIRALALQQIDKIADAVRRRRCKCEYIDERRVFPNAKPQTDQEKIIWLETELITKEAELQKVRAALQARNERSAPCVAPDSGYESSTTSDGTAVQSTQAVRPTAGDDDCKETNTTTDACHHDTHTQLQKNQLDAIEVEVLTRVDLEALEEPPVSEAWLKAVQGVEADDLGLNGMIMPTDMELLEFLSDSNTSNDGVKANEDTQQQDIGGDSTNTTSSKRKRSENLDEASTAQLARPLQRRKLVQH